MWLSVVICVVLGYDFNALMIEWKPTNCITLTCPAGYLSNAFNIHGMWTDNWDGTYPSFCGNQPFSITQQTQNLLLTSWISYTGDNLSFWQHEWTKHGTCIDPLLPCDVYFSKTVNLFQILNPQGVLASQGIVPSNTNVYQVGKAASAFSHVPTFYCSRVGNSYLLASIMFCYDHSFNWIDCKVNQSGCSSGFVMPIS
jgi:ribonuclease T2